VQVRALLPALRPAERRVAEAVLADPARVAACTITQLAQSCSTSEATVTRFCKAVGLPGYAPLRLTLASAAGDQPVKHLAGGDILPDDDLAQVVSKVTFANAQAVHDTAEQLDLGVLEQTVTAVAEAGRVDIYGIGASALVAADLQQKLHRIGLISFAWESLDLSLTSATLLGPGDVAIGISHSGETNGTIEPLAVAKENGATTVAITNFPRSSITRHAELVLTTATREMMLRSAAMASRSAQLAVVDCIFVGVVQRTYDATCDALEATYLIVHSRLGRPARR
jgi:DNA-binding MurR/RpiR family transcriptional regulator